VCLHTAPLPEVRLYNKAIILGHRRGQREQTYNTSLLKLEGVSSKDETTYYLGKRVAFVYRGARVLSGSKSRYRVIWGKITRSHGNSGVVRAQFSSNLPAHSFGAKVRVMMYPSSV